MIIKNSEINNWYYGSYTVIDENCTEGDGYVIDNRGHKYEFDWLYEAGKEGITHTDGPEGSFYTWHVPRPPTNEADFVSLWKQHFHSIQLTLNKSIHPKP